MLLHELRRMLQSVLQHSKPEVTHHVGTYRTIVAEKLTAFSATIAILEGAAVFSGIVAKKSLDFSATIAHHPEIGLRPKSI